MKKLHIIWIALMMFSITGCQTFKNERANLLVAQKGFKTAVKSLTLLRKAGKISDKDKIEISKAIKLANKNLIAWENAVIANKTSPSFGVVVQLNLDALQELLIKHEGN